LLEQHSITLERFDERDFLGLARRIPQSDAFASVEVFDAASTENILRPLDKALIKLINMQSFEHVRYPEALRMMDHAIKIDPSDRIVNYNIACLYSIMGKTNQALDFLDKMTGSGVKSIDWVINDSDLDSLHDHQRFKKFIERLKGERPVSPT